MSGGKGKQINKQTNQTTATNRKNTHNAPEQRTVPRVGKEELVHLISSSVTFGL